MLNKKKQDEAVEEKAKETAAASKEAETEAAATEAAAEAAAEAAESAEASADEVVDAKPQDPLAEAQAQAADLKDRLMRSMADFENYRKRTDREKVQSFDRGARDVIEKLLPVMDNFERALASAKEDDPMAAGVTMIYNQMKQALSDLGVKEIEALDQAFDPNLHYAVQHVEDQDKGESVVTMVLQKGYKFKDNVIRPAMVVVAN